jgi:hypothetical protein
MKKIPPLGLILLQLSIVTGCAKPDRVAVFKSPDPELFYTVEMYNGHGAASSDFTRVYAHLERDGKTDKKLVLDGEYLLVGKVTWVSANEVNLCISEGLTNSFRNEVTLSAGSLSKTIRTHLRENCKWANGT